MFDNLGENLVRAAKAVLVYGICLAWLTGIIVCFTEKSLVGILILIFGSIGAVALAAALSWMGQVLCNQKELIRLQKETVKVLGGETEPPGQDKDKTE